MSSKPKPYKHKTFPNANIKDIGLLKNEQTIERFKKIHDEEIDYIPDDYHQLILCFERLYKGIYKELRDIGAVEIIISDDEIAGKGQATPHHFARYASIINKVIPLADERNVYDSIYSAIYEEYQPNYTPARFTKNIDFETFKRDLHRLETQTARLYKGLIQQKEIHKDEIKEQEQSTEIDDWS